MFYPPEVIEEVREANNILDLISSYVSLKKKGSNYFGLCPFHSEKSASFSVRPDKQMFHCFGCGKSGNVFSFVMEYENYSFTEAVEFLADRAGITLPEPTRNDEERKAASLREMLLSVNKEAGKYYFYALRDKAGERALHYLKNRGLSDDTIRAFGLGFAQTGTNNLYLYLRSKGFDDGLLARSGIFNVDEKRGMTDKFWNRVIFPIMDIQNRIIGFGGRVMGEGKPKYLNSPETEIFDKGRNLYGLNIARTSRKKELIICEGYMDVISLHQAGFSQAVASLGTSLTQAQAKLLSRYADEILLSYDSDEAGVRAALRAIGILREAGLRCRVINMRPYKDPDEFVKNLGEEAYQKRIEEAQNSFFYEVEREEERFDLKDPAGKTSFFKEVAQKLLRFQDPLERDNYLEGISDRYQIRAESLAELVKKQAVLSENITVSERPKRTGVKEKEGGEKELKAQKRLLTWLVDEPSIYPTVKKYLAPEDFSEGLYQDVAQALFQQLAEGELNPSVILDHYSDEKERAEAALLFNSEESFEIDAKEKDKALRTLILRIFEDSANALMKKSGGDIRLMQLSIDKKKRLENIKSELGGGQYYGRE